MRAMFGMVRLAAAGFLLPAMAVLVFCGAAAAHARTPQGDIAGSGSSSTGSATFVLGRLLSGLVPPIIPQVLAPAVVPWDQLGSFDQIISHESSWNIFAANPSGAYGLGQALPADKMASQAPDWFFDPLTQLRWAYKYMNDRYGSPNAAWAFWQANHWY
jgi:hypothetical protein